jgi:Papain family cysteine protease
MSNLFKSKIIFSSLALISMTAFAEKSEYFNLNGSHSATIPLKLNTLRNKNAFDIDNMIGVKTIQLMSITPTQKMIEKNRLALAKMVADGGELDYSNGITPFSQSPGAVDLGMANVPVLDQGQYGTCVTFASTAVLDARLKKGDLIDQQCSLALNNALGNNYWNGADNATQILDPLKQYGIISKGNCFGDQYADPNQSVDAKTYQTKSTKKYSRQINYTFYGTAVLTDLKAGLQAGHRFAIGTALADTGDPISVNGFDMLIDGNQTSGGLWACQQPSSDTNFCGAQNAGHEVVVIGYDDTQQLLKIRNSWSDQVGDEGDYYMTYTFYNAMVSDQTKLN